MTKATDKLYLAILNDKRGRPSGYALCSSLKQAQGKFPDQPSSEEREAPTKNKSPFLELMQESAREMEGFRSLKSVLAFLISTGPLVQFKITVEPAMKNIAAEVKKTSDRSIYSLERQNVGEVLRTLRSATDGVNAAAQFPQLALVGLGS